MSKKQAKNKKPNSAETITAIIERAQTGDEEAMPALREILDDVPSIRDALGADLQRTVEHAISKSLGGEENLAFQEGLKRKLAAMREELEGPLPSPTERLLVDRAIACWLQVEEADLRYASSVGSCTLEQSNFYQKRQDRAHRRFLTAMKTLATVRKLALPMLQVNIGKNQVNMASAGHTLDD